ncbi:MAG: DUF2878 family protein [Candidatus Krumholzibacteria bacterium]
MKTELLIEALIYVAAVALAGYLWTRPLVLLLCYVVISIVMLRRWHTRSDVVFYSVAFVFGAAADVVAVHRGAWEYASTPLIPVWLPFLWGIAALLLKKISETFEALAKKRPR